jgi:AcrR family transcriptional regulator
MLPNDATPRRPRGRPQIRPDSETRVLMVEAAEQAFEVSGYAGTSMSAVARRAGVSTKTMYRLIPTKAELFRQVLAHRMSQFMLASTVEARDRAGLEDALARLLTAYGELILSKAAVTAYGLVLAECRRFPELARMFMDEAVNGISEAMKAWVVRHQARGLLWVDDPGLVAGILRGMMAMEPHRAMILGQGEVPSHRELAERAQTCAALFLEGCALPRPPEQRAIHAQST